MANNLQDIRCSSCGRFFGKGRVVEAEIYLLCAKCKSWTVILEGESELKITGQEIYDKLLTKKAKRDIVISRTQG